MDHAHYSDAYLRDILTSARTIAVVGASPRRERPSHRVMAYLQRHGYRAIPVNPNVANPNAAGAPIHRRDLLCRTRRHPRADGHGRHLPP